MFSTQNGKSPRVFGVVRMNSLVPFHLFFHGHFVELFNHHYWTLSPYAAIDPVVQDSGGDRV